MVEYTRTFPNVLSGTIVLKIETNAQKALTAC